MLEQEIIDRVFHAPAGKHAYSVCESLLDAGYEAWWVGGCVRDMLLGTLATDIDIATNATPEQVMTDLLLALVLLLFRCKAKHSKLRHFEKTHRQQMVAIQTLYISLQKKKTQTAEISL